jgi:hypothetical protein
MRRTYEEPISFIAQTDNKNSVKPKETKVKLCQNPTDPNSDEVSKTFTEQHRRLMVSGCATWKSIHLRLGHCNPSRHYYGQSTVIEPTALHDV